MAKTQVTKTAKQYTAANWLGIIADDIASGHPVRVSEKKPSRLTSPKMAAVGPLSVNQRIPFVRPNAKMLRSSTGEPNLLLSARSIT